MKKFTLALLSVLLMAIALPALGQARPGPVWHGGIDHFHEHDIVVWRGGRWFHGWHETRLGWWWIVGPAWYWYPAPIYPYPEPYTPPVVVQVPASPPAQPQNLPPTWYYCDRSCGILSLCSRMRQRLESSSGDSCSRARIDSTTSTQLNPKESRKHHATSGHFDLGPGYSHGLCRGSLGPECRRDARAR